MNIGEFIKHKRLENNLTLEQLGKRVGVSKMTVLRWENGEIKNIKSDKIEKLANALGIPVIATNSGGMPEILQQDFPNNIIAADEKSFSSELLKCLSKYVKSKEFVYQKGKARQCAERFSKSRYIEMIINYTGMKINRK